MQSKTLLLIGASRGLGHAMAETFVQRGWKVIGTVRDSAQHTPLHALAGEYPQQVHIEQLDICESPQITALSQRLSGQTIDMLFVNAGTTNRDPSQTIGEISTDEFMQIMLTNALSPMRVIKQFAAQVTAGGLIGVMSSGQGSIANNESGQRELYRGSKAALNMFMRSLAARPTMKARPLVTMAPGWIKTALGGPDAPYTIEETIPLLVNVLLEKQQRPGLEYLDFRGNTVPW
ncbi:SDR family NAD(P)-dependent oxidoreductase [Kluyvera cryocrescens]